MSDPAEPRTRKGGFQHDVTHLHALWRREGANVIAMAASRLTVVEIAEGLACYSEEREVGRVMVRDGSVTASPPFAAGTIFPDRVTHTELAAWLISTAARLS
jgi:hypothetical protein